MPGRILAMGGHSPVLEDVVLELAGPRVCFVPTASGDEDWQLVRFYAQCPNYDGEERRRPIYNGLVADGFPPGYAADDGAALQFVGTELREVVTARAGATAYRVEPDSETPFEARLLS